MANDPVLSPRPKPKNPKGEFNVYAQAIGDKMNPLLKEAQKTTLAGLKILDTDGTVVVGRGERYVSFAHAPEIQRALKGEYVSVIRQRVSDEAPAPLNSISRGSKIDVYVALPIIEGNRLLGVVWVNRTPKDVLKALYERREDLGIFLFLSLLVIMLISLLLASRVTEPLSSLVDELKSFSKGELKGVKSNLKIKSKSRIHEIAFLNEQVKEMIEKIEHRSQYIKNFAMHVSHEFKGPLTGLKGATEILRDNSDQMKPEEKIEFFAMLSREINRLDNLLDRLKQMAKADVYVPKNESCVLFHLLKSLQESYRAKNLKIKTDGFDKKLKVQVPADILETVFANLFDNALQNGASEVKVSASIVEKKKLNSVSSIWLLKDEDEKNRRKSQSVELMIQDDGRGISEDCYENLFTPFFTTRRWEGGTGLGLVIVKTLLESHGGSIRVEPSSHGACFKLLFS
ncbi:MAG: HAMP domain-containing sensor histidine kinase [Candidatus Caenarcaniphilales bacterium]|nr:HAMP domain-containing sensor histidine kinase [Candidatus Caenarcaniphilales bacterium]